MKLIVKKCRLHGIIIALKRYYDENNFKLEDAY
jgi:hypothetical protein